MFATALPPSVWRPGHTFIAASDLREFRILAIDDEAPGVVAGHAHDVWIVEPVKG